jgi:hypothetical protein
MSAIAAYIIRSRSRILAAEANMYGWYSVLFSSLEFVFVRCLASIRTETIVLLLLPIFRCLVTGLFLPCMVYSNLHLISLLDNELFTKLDGLSRNTSSGTLTHFSCPANAFLYVVILRFRRLHNLISSCRPYDWPRRRLLLQAMRTSCILGTVLNIISIWIRAND